MQKNVPIVIVVVVLLVVVIVIASLAGRRKQAGTPAAGPTYSATVRPTTSKEQARYQQSITSALAEAQKLYDAKNYQGALDKTQEILDTIDSTSQAAKNLKQMAQIRLIELRRAGTP